MLVITYPHQPRMKSRRLLLSRKSVCKCSRVAHAGATRRYFSTSSSMRVAGIAEFGGNFDMNLVDQVLMELIKASNRRHISSSTTCRPRNNSLLSTIPCIALAEIFICSVLRCCSFNRRLLSSFSRPSSSASPFHPFLSSRSRWTSA